MSRSCAPATSSSTPPSARRIIADGAAAAAAAAGLTLVEDEGLLAENAGLTEWPVPLLGSFDPGLPRRAARGDPAHHAHQPEIFRLHGRGRASSRPTSSASPISRPPTAARRSSPATARCSPRACPTPDSSGSRTSRSRSRSRRRSSTQIIFHEKLGTVADKVERVAKLARWLVAGADRQGRRPGPGPRPRPRARQGRPRHRDGRRVPRAAGRDRRLYRPRPGPARRRRRRDPRPLQAGRAGRRGADRAGHGRGQPGRQAGHAGRLLLDRREADRLEGSLRAAPGRAWASSRS